MDKALMLKLNGNRKVCGTLRGFDQFMNVVLDETREIVSSTEENNIGMVVSAGTPWACLNTGLFALNIFCEDKAHVLQHPSETFKHLVTSFNRPIPLLLS